MGVKLKISTSEIKNATKIAKLYYVGFCASVHTFLTKYIKKTGDTDFVFL